MRVCAEPGCGVLLPKAGRCQQHRTYSPTYLQRTHADRKARAALVADWVATHGWICPGDARHAEHESHDLTAAHRIAAALGGTIADGATVKCRSSNSADGISPDA